MGLTEKPFTVACGPSQLGEDLAKVLLKAEGHVDLGIVCDDSSIDISAETDGNSA